MGNTNKTEHCRYLKKIFYTFFLVVFAMPFFANANTQVFNSNGTWTKPSGYSADSTTLIQCWGAGGGGGDSVGLSGDDGENGQGGSGAGGGGYVTILVLLSNLPSSVPVTIGSIKTSSESKGKDSVFGSPVPLIAGGGGAGKRGGVSSTGFISYLPVAGGTGGSGSGGTVTVGANGSPNVDCKGGRGGNGGGNGEGNGGPGGLIGGGSPMCGVSTPDNAGRAPGGGGGGAHSDYYGYGGGYGGIGRCIVTVTGTITGTVAVSSNIPSSWIITGPATITGSGTSQSYSSQPVSLIPYTITWLDVAGYTTPVSTSETLTNGGTITFSGDYVVIATTGTINASASIPAGGWTISNCTSKTGFGTSVVTYTSVPTGTCTVAWTAVAGYTTPGSTSPTLTSGGTITFSGSYVVLTGPVCGDTFCVIPETLLTCPRDCKPRVQQF